MRLFLSMLALLATCVWAESVAAAAPSTGARPTTQASSKQATRTSSTKLANTSKATTPSKKGAAPTNASVKPSRAAVKATPKSGNQARSTGKSKPSALVAAKPGAPAKSTLRGGVLAKSGSKAHRSTLAAKTNPKGRRVTHVRAKSRHQIARTKRVMDQPRLARRVTPDPLFDIPEPVAAPAMERSANSSPDPWERLNPRRLVLNSEAALVIDQTGKQLYSKVPDRTMPIASITKLMTAMVVLDSGAPLDQIISVDHPDRELLGHNGSRLKRPGAALSREEMLRLALMSSENIAAAALGRTTFPEGMPAFVAAMNRKAQSLGMRRTRFEDPTGLNPGNRSCAEDLILMLRAARGYPLIHAATTTESMDVYPFPSHQSLHYVNTNRLVRSGNWDIQLSKTGFLNEAGRCLVMTTTLYDRTLDIVLLNSSGKLTHFGDSIRLRQWIANEMRRG